MSASWELVLEILIRFVCAAICGGIVGLERNFNGQYAGFRTHVLVAGGAALFTMISIICGGCPLTISSTEFFHGECGRIAAQIVSGIGFIGAGTIIKSNFEVRGVTTAACLWFATALGMACAVNLIGVAFAATGLELLFVFGGKALEKKVPKLMRFRLTAEVEDYGRIEELRRMLLDDKHKFRITVQKISAEQNPCSLKVVFFLKTYDRDFQENVFSGFQSILQKFPGAFISYDK